MLPRVVAREPEIWRDAFGTDRDDRWYSASSWNPSRPYHHSACSVLAGSWTIPALCRGLLLGATQPRPKPERIHGMLDCPAASQYYPKVIR